MKIRVGQNFGTDELIVHSPERFFFFLTENLSMNYAKVTFFFLSEPLHAKKFLNITPL